MFQVRIHGRGGQGVVTGAEMLSIAAFLGGQHAQAFPSFGSERTGAPVVAYCRISDREIRLREPILEPDALIIQDPTLLHQVDVFSGLKRNGFILINTTRSFDELGLGEFVRDFADLGDYFRLPVKTYSSGMVVRLGFALSLAVDFDCYLVDEAIAVGDTRFADRYRNALLERQARSALLLVSHIPDVVRSYCSSAAILEHGRLTRYEDLDEAIAVYQSA